MPIDRKAIMENDIKKSEGILFYASEPKYSFEEVILSENVEKKIKRLISLYKNR